jgi:hypothetical protein
MNDIDKNDVNIDNLFGWKGEFILRDLNKEIGTVYMRLIGDADINRARVYALRESAKLRRLLHDKNSDEYLALVSPAEFFTQEQLLDTIIGLYIRNFAQDASSEIILDLPPEPGSDASLEDQEEYQKEVDAYPNKRTDVIRKFVEDRLKEKKDKLDNKTQEELFNNEYLPMALDTLCETRMMEAFRDMCVFLGTFKDKEYKNKFFTNFDEFSNIKTTIKNQLKEYYMSLELGIDELKK